MGIKHDKKWIREKSLELLGMKDEERIRAIKEMSEFLDSKKERFALILFYIYGLRPEEALQLKFGDFKVVEDKLWVTLPTVKLGMPRKIRLDINSTPFLKEVADYLYGRDENARIFESWNNPTNFNHIFKKIKLRSNGKYDYNPNVFRHFRLSYLGYLGVNLETLQAWKGASDIRSISSYMTLKPVTELDKAIK